MVLVRERSQENRNFGFLSDDLLWTCLCELTSGGLIRSGEVSLIPGGALLAWSNMGCHTGVQCVWLRCAHLFFLRSSLQPPLAHLSFCPQTLNGGWEFFNHLGYCCSLGWLLNPVVTTRSLVTVCVLCICLGSEFVLLSKLISSLQIQLLLSPCLFQ